jgi:hypothetical protein
MGKRTKRLILTALALGAMIALAILPEQFPDHGMIYRAILENDAERAREPLDRGAGPNSRRAILSAFRSGFVESSRTAGSRGWHKSWASRIRL